ncbi:hypothetical protein GCM10010404_46340 [Nonomuraea africana]
MRGIGRRTRAAPAAPSAGRGRVVAGRAEVPGRVTVLVAALLAVCAASAAGAFGLRAPVFAGAVLGTPARAGAPRLISCSVLVNTDPLCRP